MAKLSKKEVGDLVGIDTKNLANYISRGKLEVNTDGEIDTEVLKNAAFIEKYKRKKEIKQSRRKDTEEISEGISGNGRPAVSVRDRSDSTIEVFEKLERQKLEAQVLELQERATKARLSNEQKQGDFIKTEHALFLITKFSEENNATWENVLEDFSTAMSAKYGLPREEMTAIKQDKIAAINRAREKTIQAVKASMRKFQSEVAVLRGRGEHD